MPLDLLPQRRTSRISLTPLIDVVFILLLFFLLTSSFQRWQALTLNSAQGGAGSAETPVLLIALTAHQSLQLKGEEISLLTDPGEIRSRLGQVSHESNVLLRPEGQASTQDIVRALDLLRSAGITRVNLVEAVSSP